MVRREQLSSLKALLALSMRVSALCSTECPLGARSVDVQVSGAEVTLRGTVRSFLEPHEAEKAAWAAPGVTAVHNHLIVDEPVYAE